MSKLANSLSRMVLLPSAISIAVNGAAAVGGILLWRAVCKVPGSLVPQIRGVDPDYIANLLDRLQASMTLIIVMAAVSSFLTTLTWFLVGWRSAIDGPGVAWTKRWTWRLIGCAFFVIFSALLFAVGSYQSLSAKIALAQLIYQSGALLAAFLLFYWIASVLGTPAKLRPAVPLASRLPIWFGF